MMMAPQVVGVLLKKPGQQSHPSRVPPLDPQETKIRGELYVEDLGERRIVSIRMGWLWVEGTTMKLPLRAMNFRQATSTISQPHALALGFTLSNSQDDSLATFWADTEPIYWSWVKAIAAELVRQTSFLIQHSFNFLEILTICPRESRRRSRSEPRGWSSNSSDEDLLGEYRGIPSISPKEPMAPTAWGCSESSEGSDDSLPWVRAGNGGGGDGEQSSVDSVDSINGAPTVIPPPPEITKEQRIQSYKEARRRENEARSRRVLEEDARRRRARAEENNNDVLLLLPTKLGEACRANNNESKSTTTATTTTMATKTTTPKSRSTVADSAKRPSELSLLRVTTIPADKREQENPCSPPTSRSKTKSKECSVRFEVARNERNNNGNAIAGNVNPEVSRSDSGERRSRARERRSVREKGLALLSLPQSSALPSALACPSSVAVESLRERKERLVSVSSKIPVPRQITADSIKTRENSCPTPLVPRSPTSPLSLAPVVEPREEDVARLLERCQRVDHYVPVREKLTLFESLSRLGGRLARSTEDLGRSTAKASPRGKQRARSLHDLNRGARSLPVREMCRFFEGEREDREATIVDGSHSTIPKTRFSDPVTPTRGTWNDNVALPRNNEVVAQTRSSTRRRHCAK